MNPRNPFFPRHTMLFKGGGGGGAPAATTIASTPPPPTSQSVEVQMAQRDAAKRVAKQKGLNKTILAGETGGYKSPFGEGGTVLGNAAPVTTERRTTVLGG